MSAPIRSLPANFNEVVNATLANSELSASHKAYIIGCFFLPVEETYEVLNEHLALENRGGEHKPPVAPGKFALWEESE